MLSCTSNLLPQAHAASVMTASDACVEFIKKAEGFSSQPYYDYNQYTVGYGTKCPTEKFFEYKSNGISKKEAEQLLRQEIADIEDAIQQKLTGKYGLTLNQHQFDALVSFSFNIGTGWMTYDSTLRNAVLRNASDSDLVYAFGLYCTAGGKYLPGLVTRRLCEANMFLNNVYSHTVSDDFGYVYYDADGGTVDYRVQAFICDKHSAPAADAERNGDIFLGWYTDLSGGSQVTALTGEVTGKTLFARWQTEADADDQDSTSITIKVTGDVVNIRSGPGTNYGITGRAYRNDVLTVSHVTHLTNMKWGKVSNGWICLDYTTYDDIINGSGDVDDAVNQPSEDDTVSDMDQSRDDPDTAPDTQEVITGIVNVNDFLKIRSGPGTTYETVGFLFNGNKIEILEQKTVGTMVWGRIKNGWVCMNYIRTDHASTDEPISPDVEEAPEKEPVEDTAGSDHTAESVSIKGTITADALRIRSGAGTANSIVGFYYQDDTVVISQKKLVGTVYWGKTGRGWISMDYVSTDPSNNEYAHPSDNSVKTVTADCLRIRKDAGTNHKIVGFLYDGDTVSVLETKTVDGTAWGRVSQGWICMTYVK